VEEFVALSESLSITILDSPLEAHDVELRSFQKPSGKFDSKVIERPARPSRNIKEVTFSYVARLISAGPSSGQIVDRRPNVSFTPGTDSLETLPECLRKELLNESNLVAKTKLVVRCVPDFQVPPPTSIAPEQADGKRPFVDQLRSLIVAKQTTELDYTISIRKVTYAEPTQFAKAGQNVTFHLRLVTYDTVSEQD